jgi:hypothetical protein
VRLLSRNGSHWTRRYPWIVEDALKNREKHSSLTAKYRAMSASVPPIAVTPEPLLQIISDPVTKR